MLKTAKPDRGLACVIVFESEIKLKANFNRQCENIL
jgi:hypothetical protein